MNTKTIVTAVIALIIGGGIGYTVHNPKTQTFTQRGNFTASNAAFSGARGMMGDMGGFLTGTVAAKSPDSITLNTRDGSSHVILLTPATSVSKSVTGALTDVSVGSTIMIIGTTNSDGSVSASSIQLRPATSTPGAP